MTQVNWKQSLKCLDLYDWLISIEPLLDQLATEDKASVSSRFERLFAEECKNAPCPSAGLPDEDKAVAILQSMTSSLTGEFASVAVFVDEMTVFNMKSSETPLGQR